MSLAVPGGASPLLRPLTGPPPSTPPPQKQAAQQLPFAARKRKVRKCLDDVFQATKEHEFTHRGNYGLLGPSAADSVLSPLLAARRAAAAGVSAVSVEASVRRPGATGAAGMEVDGGCVSSSSGASPAPAGAAAEHAAGAGASFTASRIMRGAHGAQQAMAYKRLRFGGSEGGAGAGGGGGGGSSLAPTADDTQRGTTAGTRVVRVSIPGATPFPAESALSGGSRHRAAAAASESSLSDLSNQLLGASLRATPRRCR
jgi:hypothetical protein